MGTHRLICHPDTPASQVSGVVLRWIEANHDRLILRWQVDGAEGLFVPPFAGKGRDDGLWQTTCVELFLMDAAGGYREFNFSPSERWAAYRFTAYREGMSVLPLEPPAEIEPERGEHVFLLTVTLDAGLLQGTTAAAVSAVIEETDGTKSYWALAHPPGRPDFHHPTCFAATLAPPGQP